MLRLEQQAHFPAFDRTAQIDSQLTATALVLVHRRVEQAQILSKAVLGTMEREIGVVENRVRITAMPGNIATPMQAETSTDSPCSSTGA
jgi:hypothetical protein